MHAVIGYYLSTDDTKLWMIDVFVEKMESLPTKKFFGAGIACVVVEIPRPQCGMSNDMSETTEMKPWLWALR